MYNYAPQWEAVSKEIRLLAEERATLGKTRIVGLNQRGRVFGRDGRAVFLPAAFAILAPFFVRLAQARRSINHVFASAGERFLLSRLDPTRTLLTVSKTPPPLPSIERNLPTLRRLRHIVVESERDKEILRQGGIPEASLTLIYPGAVVAPYRPASGPFTVLFATSPLAGSSLLERGVHLIVQTAQSLPDVRFLLIWRKYHLAAIRELIARAGVRNVELRNGVITAMGEVYDSVHATILPGLEYGSLKPTPHSALESLAHGKPVLASTPTSIAGVLSQHQCGVVFDPDARSLHASILHLRENYQRYQTNCHSTVNDLFSPRVFLERYRRVYDSML